MVSSFHAAASDSVDSHHAEDAAPAVRHVVFAVAPELVLLDACGPLEAFWRAELAVAARFQFPNHHGAPRLQLVWTVKCQVVEQDAVEADFHHGVDPGRNRPQQVQIAAH